MFQAIQIAAIVALRDTEATVESQSKIYEGRRNVLVSAYVAWVGKSLRREPACLFGHGSLNHGGAR